MTPCVGVCIVSLMNEDSFLDSYWESKFDMGDDDLYHDDLMEWETEQVYLDMAYEDFD